MEKRSPIRRAGEVRSPVGKAEPSDIREIAERQQVRGGHTSTLVANPLAADRAGIERAAAERAGAERAGAERAGAERAGAERAGPERAGADRAGTERVGSERPTRSDSLPPRRPPPPAVPPAAPAPHQRLARAHSHVAPARPPDPPTVSVHCNSPPLSSTSQPTLSDASCFRRSRRGPARQARGPRAPRRLCHRASFRQLRTSASHRGERPPGVESRCTKCFVNWDARMCRKVLGDICPAQGGEADHGDACRRGTVVAGGASGTGGAAGARRGPPQRQASVTAPFASTNPFTSPRHAEFVIPQRNNVRRSSTTDRS